jgi:hypothetical protein
LEGLPPEATDEQQQQLSPVEVAVKILEDLAEFRRTSSPEAFRAEARAACEEAFRQGMRRGGQPDEIIEYLERRGLIRTAPRKKKKLRKPRQVSRARS